MGRPVVPLESFRVPKSDRCVSAASSSWGLTPTSFFGPADRARLLATFRSAEASAPFDLAAVHPAALGLKLLGEKPKDTTAACKKVQESLKAGADLTIVYQAAEAGKALDCKLKAPAEITQVTIPLARLLKLV